MFRRCILLLAVTLLTAACRQSDVTYPTTFAPDGGNTPGSAGPDDGPGSGTASDPDQVVAVALADVERFWVEHMPEVYGLDFEPLAGGLFPYGPDTEIPQCGPERLDYIDLAENALYCPISDYIAWDRVALIPPLQDQFGPLTTGIVMAHEFAHAVQVRADVDGRTVTLELQADCFAGAWLADSDDRIPTFSTAGTALDLAMAGLLELRDSLGVSGADPDAHGSGFDRVGAFQDGFERGPATCARYEASPPDVVAIPFGSLQDQRTGGNLPLSELIEPLVADLESFFTALFAEDDREWRPVGEIVPVDPAVDTVTCGDQVLRGDELAYASFYCVDSNSLIVDAVGLVPALEEIGDFAFGGELARLYAFSAQAQLGILGNTRETDLHADCLAGVYAAAEFLQRIPDQQLVLSPGDLDEIIIAFLAFGSEGTATAFERTAAFRAGFVDGIGSCQPLLDG